MQLILRTYTLPMKYTFRISRQAFDAKTTLIVELRDGEHSGYGEASENPYYLQTAGQMLRILLERKETIESWDSSASPESFWAAMAPLFPGNTFALCALDVAYHDLFARKRGKKLYELWGLNTDRNPLSNYTIGIDTTEKMIAKMAETPWPVYKIKLGTDRDMEIVRALRKHSDALFRIDANCAWSVEKTLANAAELKELGVEFIEQPLPADDRQGSRYLFLHSEIPILADESCRVEKDVDKCFGHFHGVNIKIMKCGGITPALRMIQNAKSKHMKVMVGCMTESSVGISAIAHLLPLLDYADMDGALLLREDIATGVRLEMGRAIFPDTSGTCVTLKGSNAEKTYT